MVRSYLRHKEKRLQDKRSMTENSWMTFQEKTNRSIGKKNDELSSKAFTVKNLITGTPVVDWRKVSDTYVHLKEANIPEANDSDRVHVLLGTDYAHLNASSKSICGGDMEPVAEFTKLGWAFLRRS